MFDKLELKRVINASGKMSVIGVSTPSQPVLEAMIYGASNFFEIDQLQKEVGIYLSSIYGFESARIVSSASSGIALTVAASISKDDPKLYKNPYDINYEKREIILPKGHNVDFGAPIETMVQVGGGKVVEAGYANKCTVEDVEVRINENTAALLFIKSHHTVQKSMIDLKEMVNLSKKHDIPLIIDAAAEEDIQEYTKLNADFVIFSGAKAIEGPTSGIVFGKTESISWLQHQELGIGRAMKIGKESIFGLAKALEEYVVKEDLSKEDQLAILNPFVDELNTIENLYAEIVQDEAGRNIYRARLHYENMPSLVAYLKKASPAVYTRDYNQNIGMIDFDIRAIKDEEFKLIIKKIKEALDV